MERCSDLEVGSEWQTGPYDSCIFNHFFLIAFSPQASDFSEKVWIETRSLSETATTKLILLQLKDSNINITNILRYVFGQTFLSHVHAHHEGNFRCTALNLSVFEVGVITSIVVEVGIGKERKGGRDHLRRNTCKASIWWPHLFLLLLLPRSEAGV